MKRFIGGLAIIAISLSTTSTAIAAPAKFKNCAALLKAYPAGIANSAKVINRGAGPIRTAKVSSAIYSANKSLDTDKDGIACEVVIKIAPELPAITLDNLDASRTREVAQRYVEAAISKAPAVSESILIVRAGPSLVPSDYELAKKSLLTAASLFSSLSSLPVNVNWFSSADADWVDQAITESGGDPRATPTRQPFSQWIKAVGKAGCNMGNASTGTKGPYFNQCLKSGAPSNLAAETASHEYFHTVQTSVTTLNQPVWFIEGSATFIGIHVGGFAFGSFTAARNFALNRYATSGMDESIRAAISSGDKDFVISRLKQLESANPTQAIRESAYPLGMLITEALVASGGFDNWTSYLSQIKSLGFEGSLKANYGLSLDELYQKTAGYLISQLQR